MNPAMNLPAPRLTGRRLAITLAGLMLSMFLAAIDGTIVATAMPRIIGDLNGFEQYSWVTTAYLLTSTATIPIMSKLSDIFGRKRILLIAVIGFIITSGLCGAAQSMVQLVAFRGLQGVFGGGLMALAFASMADIFTPTERGKWMGLFFAMFGVASVAGPLLGGFITENFSWRWVFFVNLPVGIAATIVLASGFPSRIGYVVAGGWRKIDFLGSLLMVVSTTTLLLGLVEGGQSNVWFTPNVMGMLAVAVATFVAFIVWERRAPEPLIPLDMFRSRTVTAATAVGFFAGILMIGTMLYTPLYAQAVLGDSPTAAGATIMPLMLTTMIGNTLFGRLLSRFGRFKPLMLVGVVLLPIGTGLLTLLGTGAGDRTIMVAGLILVGFGLSAIMPASGLAVQNALPPHQIGAGTGMNTFVRSIGQSVGSAVIGAVVIGTYFSTLPAQLPADASRLPADVLQQVTNPSSLGRTGATAAGSPAGALDPALLNGIQNAVHESIASGIHTGYVAAFLVTLAIAALIVLALPDDRLRGRRPNAEQKPAATPVPEAVGARG